MPTSTTNDPFAPRGAQSRERIERYVRGELTPAEQHELELLMEQDPLLSDAVDGLRQPGALDAVAGLNAHRPADAGTSGRVLIVSAVLLMVGLGAWWVATRQKDAPELQPSKGVAEVITVPVTEAQQAAFQTELREATALPESLRSAFRGSDRFVQPPDTTATTLREDPPQAVDALPPAVVDPAPLAAESPKSVAPPRHSRKLLPFPDLKLVDPSELYPFDPTLELAGGSVDARYGDAEAKAASEPFGNRVPYDRFFRTAMNKFMRGDRQGCLEDLFVVLEEYPEDVNALFYAGLCCYDLGLFPRAVVFLDSARKHEVDTFAEEADWYHALAVDRAFGREEALPFLRAVEERNGFYAGRARERLAMSR